MHNGIFKIKWLKNRTAALFEKQNYCSIISVRDFFNKFSNTVLGIESDCSKHVSSEHVMTIICRIINFY